MSNDKKRFKVVFVGDCAVGKTCLLISFTENEFDEDHVPTVIDNRIQTVKYKDEDVILNLWDTAGQEDFDNLRLLSYPETDIFIVCFSVVCPDSLKNIKQLWMKEISEHGKAFSQTVPCILVGTKTDLRTDERTLHDLKEIGQEPVSFEKAQQFAQENGFYFYRECSALTREGIEEVIQSAIEAKIEVTNSVNGTNSEKVTNTPRRKEEGKSSSDEAIAATEENNTVNSSSTLSPKDETSAATPRNLTEEPKNMKTLNDTSSSDSATQQQANLILYPWLILASLMKCKCEIL
ncbi:hypothetical protein C9374_007887 [Naegleria lovaniensis]|uniref:Rho family small GTPase n=1 Tax=Naegleria lovaniensis TaxID=51637 RepID=A0AA88GJN3_NAELO|nr:uncharacterized protein C9374_007887 [Naegleria lovaniensis]KAG2378739.1 hypothetical protein C9374_007887 [Naegleria lovaniensis]